MKNKELGGCFLILAFSFSTVACSLITAPIRPMGSHPSGITLIILERPEILQKGETGTFSVRTDSTNTCSGSIGYRDKSGKWISIELPELKADKTGICRWTWTVPLQLSAGIAEFRVAARRQGEFDMLIPQTFCIEKCP